MFIVPLNWANAVGATDPEPYNMADYHCAIVSPTDGARIIEALNLLRNNNDARTAVGISIHRYAGGAVALNSNLGGIKFILSYFADDTYIENCINENDRHHPEYIALMDQERPRLSNAGMVASEIGRLARHQTPLPADADVEEAVEADPEPVQEIDSATALVLDMNRMGQGYVKHVEESGVVVMPKPSENDVLLSSLQKLSHSSGKKVCAIFNSSQFNSIPNNSWNDMLFVVFNTHAMNCKTKPVLVVSTDDMENDRVACLGRYCSKTVLPQKKQGEHYNPYFGLDRIWSDEATGVMYGCRKDSFIYVTVVFDNVEDYAVVVSRIADKWARGVSTAEADVELMKGLVNVDKAAYIRQSADGANSYIKQIKDKLEEVDDSIRDMQQKLMDAMKMRRQLNEVVESFNPDEYERKMREQAQVQFDAVSAMDKVKSIYVGEDGVVTVLTKEIHCKDPRTNKIHNIGKLMIKLNMLTPKYHEQNNIRIKNLTHRVQAFSGRYMMAPHIYEDGHICHGNLSQLIIQHYAERDIYAIMEDLFAFVESVNTEDGAGKMIVNWPEVEEVVASPEDETDDELIRNLKGGI